MDVTDVLRDRMQEPKGLQQMVAVSITVHAALIAAAIFVPGGLLSRSQQTPATVMTISLAGGGEGPRNGGLTAIGGRPVQAVAPPEVKREAVRPPAAKTLEPRARVGDIAELGGIGRLAGIERDAAQPRPAAGLGRVRDQGESHGGPIQQGMCQRVPGDPEGPETRRGAPAGGPG